MIELWHMPRTRSLRVLWALEELELEYQLHAASFMQPTAEFLEINPACTLPVLRDGEAVLTESIAILQFLAGRYGPTPLAVGPDEPGYADYLQFLVLGEAGLSAPLNALIGTKFMAPADQQRNFTTGVIVTGFSNRLKLVEKQLADGREFVAADRFTLADISVAWSVGLAKGGLQLGDRMAQSLHQHYDRMTARPAYQRAAAVAV
jgi:glutathione S-transferase